MNEQGKKKKAAAGDRIEYPVIKPEQEPVVAAPAVTELPKTKKARIRRVGCTPPLQVPPVVQDDSLLGGENDALIRVTSKHDEKWNAMFLRLLEYKKNHDGSTSVPQCYHDDPALGRWVHYQRVEVRMTYVNVFIGCNMPGSNFE
jgi:hypothetical protein